MPAMRLNPCEAPAGIGCSLESEYESGAMRLIVRARDEIAERMDVLAPYTEAAREAMSKLARDRRERRLPAP